MPPGGALRGAGASLLSLYHRLRMPSVNGSNYLFLIRALIIPSRPQDVAASQYLKAKFKLPKGLTIWDEKRVGLIDSLLRGWNGAGT